jgi:hypothetical protein
VRPVAFHPPLGGTASWASWTTATGWRRRSSLKAMDWVYGHAAAAVEELEAPTGIEPV